MTIRKNKTSEAALGGLSRKALIIKDLVPLNLEAERERWLANRKYSPVFEYRRIKFEEDLLPKLRGMRFDDSPEGQIFREKRNETIKKIELLQAVGREDFSEKSGVLFPWPDAQTVNQAKADLKNANWKKQQGPFFDSRKLKKIFEWRFKEYGLGWVVEEVDFPDGKLSVNKKNTLKLGRSTRYSLERAMTAVRHEIDTHVLRTENGKLQPLKAFQTGFPGYTLTEEGLAVYQVSRLRLNILKSFIPQIRVVALNEARKASFARTAETVMDLGLSARQAWNIVWRLKRGLADTRRPGGFSKDGSYYIGCRRVAEYAQKGKLEDLYVGKIGLEHLDLVSRLPGLKKPRFLPLPLKREDLERFL